VHCKIVRYFADTCNWNCRAFHLMTTSSSALPFHCFIISESLKGLFFVSPNPKMSCKTPVRPAAKNACNKMLSLQRPARRSKNELNPSSPFLCLYSKNPKINLKPSKSRPPHTTKRSMSIKSKTISQLFIRSPIHVVSLPQLFQPRQQFQCRPRRDR
jgi:hypothetical protein